MIQLIASDMDGTLLGPKMTISEENQQAIQYAKENGITFMVATGRGYTEAKPVLTEAGIDCPMITVNGAQAFDSDGELLFTISIDKENIQNIISILQEKKVYFEIATTEGVYSDNIAQRIENVATMIAKKMPHVSYKTAVSMAVPFLDSLQVTYIKDYQYILNHPTLEVLKFIVFSEDKNGVLQPLEKEIMTLPDITVTSSFENNIEINHRNATKGAAVQHIANKLGIDMDNVMTIGDNFNDISMLEVAGVSFAMENAENTVKETAKYQTASNVHNGAGKAIIRAINEQL